MKKDLARTRADEAEPVDTQPTAGGSMASPPGAGSPAAFTEK